MVIPTRPRSRRISNVTKASSVVAIGLLASLILSIGSDVKLTWNQSENGATSGGKSHSAHATHDIGASRLDTSSKPIKIAHAVSIIKCQREGTVRGMMDALAVLRHSIHMNSVHANAESEYSYQMYAFVHQENCANPHIPAFLRQMGYIPLLKSSPVNVSSIPNEWYRAHVEGENCCGSSEFIKLYAYTLTDHPVVVHWDLDVAVLRPMDDLFDAIILDKDSPEGRAARSRLRIQRPTSQKLPDRIDAFLTRDITSAKPWERVTAVQGGFLVARPNMDHFNEYLKFITAGHYLPGRGEGSGWGGLGYGGFQGAMAYQGVLAYFYDIVHKGFHVELDVCRWNQVVADVIWRGPDGPEHMHECRDFPSDGDFKRNTPENGACEDCRILPIEETMTVHYTACKKPWTCTLPVPRTPRPRMAAHTYRLQQLTNATTCGKLLNKWFTFREQVDGLIDKSLSRDDARTYGSYEPSIFKGYCKESGDSGYLPMETLPADFEMSKVYGF